ncbi:MAG TPA: GNAT family N-acetyltransferase, partial [Vulgatibacter sp.]
MDFVVCEVDFTKAGQQVRCPNRLNLPAASGVMSPMTPSAISIQQLGPNDLQLMHGMLSLFGEAFGDHATYGEARPSGAYLERLLCDSTFFAIAAVADGGVVGALAAYELRKFEQERSEVYIYDLAVAETHRRRGIATMMIDELRRLAAERGAYVIFVQADYGD